mgnify:CR=1 FL=1
MRKGKGMKKENHQQNLNITGRIQYGIYVTASEQQNSTCWGWQSKYWEITI